MYAPQDSEQSHEPVVVRSRCVIAAAADDRGKLVESNGTGSRIASLCAFETNRCADVYAVED